MDLFKWYALRVRPGQELKVKELLEQCLKESAFKSFFKEILVPVKTVVEVKRGEKVNHVCKCYPGYVFACMHLYDESGNCLRDVVGFTRRIQGVLGFMGTESPTPLRASEVEGLLVQSASVKRKKAMKTSYVIGESVKVIDGPFLGSLGVVDAVDSDQGRLRISLSMFGRSTPINLECWQVQKEV